MLVGFYLPDKGDIKIYGESIYKKPELVKRYVRIPFLISDPRFTVYETLKLTAKFWGIKNWKEEIEYWMEYFDLVKEKDTEIQKLSTGNQQRVRIIGGILSRPKLLILDEITNGLDLESVNKLIDMLKKLNRDYNIAILFASHIFPHVERLCKRVIILYYGKLLADGPLDELIKQAQLKEYITLQTIEKLPDHIFETLRKKFDIIKINNTTYKIVCDDASKTLKELAKFLAEHPTIDQYIKDIGMKKIGLDDIYAYFVAKQSS